MTALIDVETDSANSKTANLKYFGGFDIETREFTLLPHTSKKEIISYLNKHKVLIGFNLKGFDIPVIERFGISMKYKVILDLYEVLAPKGDNGFGKNNKGRLKDINPGLKIKNYKLKTIIDVLGLDDEGSKGEFDYDILKKKEWDKDNILEIEKYLKQDLLIEYKLFEWYRDIFKPLEPYLKKEDVEKLKHLSVSSGCLAYKFVCSQTGIKEEYLDYESAKKLKNNSKKIHGGYHIHPKWEKVRGNIICRDFVSHYPTTIVQHQLHTPKINDATEKCLRERLKAKTTGDKKTALALKVPLNSIYGTCGSALFKNIYNPEAADNCTRICRELIKRYAKTLDVAGFKVLYGFTDSVYAGIPKGLTTEDLDLITDIFVDETRAESIKPLDSYGLGIDGVYKFMWFIEKKDNNYLWVDSNNKIGIKGGLFDKNTPKCINQLFEDYITPKIIKDLDISFTEEELLSELKQILIQNPELAAEEYLTKPTTEYKTESSIQYQISLMYGPGKHLLIPNTSDIGVGRNKNLKYCSIEDFNNNKLTTDSICFDKMLRYLKPFYTTKEEVLDLNSEASQ